MSKEILNPLLYDYINIAYNYVKSINSTDMVSGEPGSFIAGLYRSRVKSVYSDLSNHLTPLNDIQEFTSWLNIWDRTNSERTFQGFIDGLSIEQDSQDSWLASYEDFARKFEEDADRSGGQVNDYGLDAYATYLPIHFFHDIEDFTKTRWGIYISEDGVGKLAAALKQAFEKDRAFGKPIPEKSDHLFLQIAYQLLLRHELFHFRIESFSLNAELISQKSLYVPYLFNVYQSVYNTHDCFEEALANRSALDSNVIRDIFATLYPNCGKQWQRLIEIEIFDRQPGGYSNYHLEFSKKPHWNEKSRNYISTWNVVNKSPHPLRQMAINDLCNQIMTGSVDPVPNQIPFFAFLPDNYFLRSENLVPIHIVKSLDPDEIFINLAPPKKRDWESLLRAIGYGKIPKKGKGDHERWDHNLLQTITVNYDDGELDWNSLNSALKSFGITKKSYQHHRRSGRPLDELSNLIQLPQT